HGDPDGRVDRGRRGAGGVLNEHARGTVRRGGLVAADQDAVAGSVDDQEIAVRSDREALASGAARGRGRQNLERGGERSAGGDRRDAGDDPDASVGGSGIQEEAP